MNISHQFIHFPIIQVSIITAIISTSYGRLLRGKEGHLPTPPTPVEFLENSNKLLGKYKINKIKHM